MTNALKQANATAMMDAVNSISTDATASMKDLAAAQAERATRLTAVGNRLQKSPQPPSGLVQKLNQQATASNSVAQAAGSFASRVASRPAVDPADLAVFGRVLPAAGTSLPQVWVRLSDHAGTLSVGSRVKADASGDFSLVFKSCEIPAAGTHLIVVAEDANAVRLDASGPVTLKAGSPVYLELTLPNPPASTPPTTTPATPPPRHGKPRVK